MTAVLYPVGPLSVDRADDTTGVLPLPSAADPDTNEGNRPS